MGAIWMCAREVLRRRRAGAVVIAVLIALSGGTVLAAVAGARRTATSFDRFRQETEAGHLIATFAGPFDGVEGGGEPQPELARKIARLPGVASTSRIFSMAAYDPAHDFGINLFATIDGHLGTRFDRSRLLEGRYADATSATEVTLSESSAKGRYKVGDVINLVSFTPEQIADFAVTDDYEEEPRGPTLRLDVVGIERRPFDLTPEGQSAGVTFLTPAFYRTYRDQVGTFLGEYMRIRLERGPEGIPAFIRSVRGFTEAGEVGFRNESFDTGGIRDSIDVLTVGLLLFAAIAGLAGLVALGQAIGRQAASGAAGHEVLRALGMSRTQHAVALAAAIQPAVVAGSVLAVAAAFAVSAVMPLGIAEQAEPNPGLTFDVLVLGVGGLVLLILGLAITTFAAWRAARASAPDALVRRTPAFLTAISQAGLGPAATAGVRMAVDSGRGDRAAPTRSAVAGTALAVAGVLAVVVFSSSLDRLATTPARYGFNWDVATASRSNGDAAEHPCEERSAADAADRAVEELGVVCVFRIVLDRRPVQAMGFGSFRGTITPTIIAGRAPRNSREVALGAKTLVALDREIGDVVTARDADGERRRYEIVGQAVFPLVGEVAPLSEGAAFTTAGLNVLDTGSTDYLAAYLLRFRPDVDQAEATHRFARAGEQQNMGPPRVPDEIERVQEVDALPPVLGALLVVLALLAVGHTLVTGVRRRRRELAVLKTLGFTRRQVFSTVAWNASTLGALGLLAGIPLGIVAGRVAWGFVADNLGVASDPVISALAIVAVVPAALVIANVLAVLPARTAARTRPAVALRAE